uniref:Reverse transcriptase domain-containing protein n=1 Tax=Lactuca sativa TaxID=4236 RepID=A0A9R1VCL4_LACSA|nr:hypothetical protein LSAT_V11C500266950 [Lactuca sativa]
MTSEVSQFDRKKGQSIDMNKSINDELDKLEKAGILRESLFPSWVANPVLTCIDFTNLNKSYPKDFYSLPSIDEKIESLHGHKWIFFMGWRKNIFSHIERDILLYKNVIWIKNARATYQRLANKVFEPHLRRSIKLYVDDMLIRSGNDSCFLHDITETFSNLGTTNMKLNPQKCIFGIEEGKFLGHAITKDGIKANPPKSRSVTRNTIAKDSERTALGRFLEKSAKKTYPFYKTLKRTKEVESAFCKLKVALAELPTLPSPLPGEVLTMYLATSRTTTSVVFVTPVDQG